MLLCFLPKEVSSWLIQIGGHILTAALYSAAQVGERGPGALQMCTAGASARRQFFGDLKQDSLTAVSIGMAFVQRAAASER